MNITFNKYYFTIDKYQNKKVLLESLNKYKEKILLGSDIEQEENFYIITLFLDDFKFAIGMIAESCGLLPSILMINDLNKLYFGFNKEIIIFDINGLSINRTIKIDVLFHRFIHLYHSKIILAFYETGIITLTEKGDQLWKIDTDLITNYKIQNDKILFLEFMDTPSSKIDIINGKEII